MQPVFFITGTDTGVGKTVLGALLTQYLRRRGIKVAALKPVCSGGRADARILQSALANRLTLDEINPWHFQAPLAPLLAARREGRRVRRAEVRAHIRKMQYRFDVVLVEGAGGLLSPLGEDFNSRDLIAALHAKPIIVAQSRLGVLNQLLLTLEALPGRSRKAAKIVLMSPPKPDLASASNARLLRELLPPDKILTVPWMQKRLSPTERLAIPAVQRALAKIMD
ncbi:MAG TPA: dethiobiotin synthase [Candidatus Acidoferrum sp.]|nr:dethiobiotin synthase [Candidatus Acidoferrum sp.]